MNGGKLEGMSALIGKQIHYLINFQLFKVCYNDAKSHITQIHYGRGGDLKVSLWAMAYYNIGATDFQQILVSVSHVDANSKSRFLHYADKPMFYVSYMQFLGPRPLSEYLST